MVQQHLEEKGRIFGGLGGPCTLQIGCKLQNKMPSLRTRGMSRVKKVLFLFWNVKWWTLEVFHKSLIFCCSDLRRFLSLSVLMFMADFLSFLCSRQAGVLFYLFMAGGFFLFIVHDRISFYLLFMSWGNFFVFIVPGRVRFLSFYCSWQEDGRIAWPAVWLNSIVHFCHCEFFLLANGFFTSYIFINSF